MQHRRKKRKFSRIRSQRKSLLRNLAFSLFEHGRIMTTEAKGKELRPYAEKLITMAKQGTPETIRLLKSRIPEKAAQKLVKKIAPGFQGRKGGYMRIVKLGIRKGDASQQVLVELLS